MNAWLIPTNSNSSALYGAVPEVFGGSVSVTQISSQEIEGGSYFGDPEPPPEIPVELDSGPTYKRPTPAVITGNIKILMHFDDPGTPFLDATGREWEAGYVGEDAIDTTMSKFGAACATNIMGNAFASYSSDFNFAGDFEFEVWVYGETFTGRNGVSVNCFAMLPEIMGTEYTVKVVAMNNYVRFFCKFTRLVPGEEYYDFVDISHSGDFIEGAWNHVVFYRKGDVFAIGLNGHTVASVESDGIIDTAPWGWVYDPEEGSIWTQRQCFPVIFDYPIF